jgi:hypothetical protein
MLICSIKITVGVKFTLVAERLMKPLALPAMLAFQTWFEILVAGAALRLVYPSSSFALWRIQRLRG